MSEHAHRFKAYFGRLRALAEDAAAQPDDPLGEAWADLHDALPPLGVLDLLNEVERAEAQRDRVGQIAAETAVKQAKAEQARDEARADAEHWKAMVRDDRNLAAEALENLGRTDAELAAACAVIANVRGLNAVLADVETQTDGDTELVTCRVVLAADLVDALAGLTGAGDGR